MEWNLTIVETENVVKDKETVVCLNQLKGLTESKWFGLLVHHQFTRHKNQH